MPCVEIRFEVWSNKGFSEKIYRHEALVGGGQLPKFSNEDLTRAAEFLRDCMNEFNRGERGLRYGRGVTHAKEGRKVGASCGQESAQRSGQPTAGGV